MNNNLFFSIIIPTYNRADKLKRALDSIANQTVKNYEIIVCDDGSNDHTSQIVHSFDKRINIKYLWEENWGGPARPRNRGIKNAKGEWICFLDSDDWWYPDKLEVISKHLHDGDILYHDLHIYNKKGKTFRKILGRNLNTPVFVDLMTKGNALATSSVVVKKAILNSVNLFDEDKKFIAVEDFDAWLKIAKVTEKFVYVPLSLGGYWMGEGHATEVSEKQIERLADLYKKYEMFLSAEDKIQANAINSYGMGRIKWKLGSYDEAIILFKLSLKSKNFEIKIKSLIMIILIYVVRGA
jgi:glycosyltransferase involved in cell wall biosynthesis